MRADIHSFREIERHCTQAAEGAIAFIPVGCTEQHGPLLPLGTDSIIATRLAEDLCVETAKQTPGIVYPTIPYSPSRSNMNFPGSTSTDEDAFRAYIESICNSILTHRFRLIILVCMHGPAEPSLTEIAFKLNHRQASSSEKLIPLIVMGVSKLSHIFQDILGEECGKHADSKEFLLLYKVLGQNYFTPEKLKKLEIFDASYQQQNIYLTAIPGIPTERRSVDGVIGRPLPQNTENLQGLADSLWDRILNQLTEEIDKILAEEASG